MKVFKIEIIYITHGAVQRTLVLSRDFYLWHVL